MTPPTHGQLQDRPAADYRVEFITNHPIGHNHGHVTIEPHFYFPPPDDGKLDAILALLKRALPEGGMTAAQTAEALKGIEANTETVASAAAENKGG